MIQILIKLNRNGKEKQSDNEDGDKKEKVECNVSDEEITPYLVSKITERNLQLKKSLYVAVAEEDDKTALEIMDVIQHNCKFILDQFYYDDELRSYLFAKITSNEEKNDEESVEEHLPEKTENQNETDDREVNRLKDLKFIQGRINI